MSSLQDLIVEIKSRANIIEVIKACEIGKFEYSDGKFRGQHGTHDGGSRDCIVDARNHWWKCFKCGQGGDIVKWVLSVKFNYDISRYRDAVHWLADFYGLQVTESPIDLTTYQVYDLLTELSWRFHNNLMALPERLEWVKNKWGLTEETITELRIGWCDTALEAEIDTSTLIPAGLVDSMGTSPLSQRVVFPYFRRGQCVWMAGRLPYESADSPKYTCLFSTLYVKPTLYNLDNAHNTEGPIVFTEGLGDVARAYQDGLRCVAPGGAQAFSINVHEDAKALLKTCKDLKYVIYDEDDAGRKGARALAQTLITFGTDPYIVNLPVNPTGGRYDLCDYLNTNTLSDLGALMTKAVLGDKGADVLPTTLPNILIDECPKSPESDTVEAILKVIAPLTDILISKYVQNLARKTQSKEADLKKALTKIRASLIKTKLKIDEDYQRPVFLANDYVYHEDIDVWRAHRTVYIPFITENEETGAETKAPFPVHIAVDLLSGGTYTLTTYETLSFIPPSLEPFIPSREIIFESQSNIWSISTKFSHSFINFVEGAAVPVDTVDLYNRIYTLFEKYVYLPYDTDKHILVLYILLTYIFMGVEAVPYLHLHGKKNSGKSRIMEIMSALCFNAVAASTISPSALFRSAHSTRPTFIIDEAEQLRNPPAGTPAAELLTLCLGSYAKNDMAKSIRSQGAGNDWQPTGFYTYGPKILGSIASFKDTLSSRAITIKCNTPSIDTLQSLADWEQDKSYLLNDLQDIRDKLQVWSLTQFRQVRASYDTFSRQRADFLLSRNRQIWLPLIAIAETISAKIGYDVVKIVLDNAAEKVKISQIESAAGEFSNVILISIFSLYLINKTAFVSMAAKSGVEHIQLSEVVKLVKLKLTEEAYWQEDFHKLDSSFVLSQLRQLRAIPPNARATTIREHGGRKEMYPFNFQYLKEFLVNAGLVEEAEDGIEDTQVDELN